MRSGRQRKVETAFLWQRWRETGRCAILILQWLAERYIPLLTTSLEDGSTATESYSFPTSGHGRSILAFWAKQQQCT